MSLFLFFSLLVTVVSAVRDFECNSGINCAQLINRAGFAVIRGAIDPGLIDEVSALANRNADDFTAALMANSIITKPLSHGSEALFVDEPGRSEGYFEIQWRGYRRYEIHHNMTSIDVMMMGEKTVLHDAIEVLFRSNFRRDSHSLVMSYAGAAPNHWHQDGEVRLGSVEATANADSYEYEQLCAKYTAEPPPTADQPSPTAPPAPPPGCVTVQVSMQRGDVLVWDYRLFHRGLANTGKGARPALTYVFSKPWFFDSLNRPAVSVFDHWGHHHHRNRSRGGHEAEAAVTEGAAELESVAAAAAATAATAATATAATTAVVVTAAAATAAELVAAAAAVTAAVTTAVTAAVTTAVTAVVIADVESNGPDLYADVPKRCPRM